MQLFYHIGRYFMLLNLVFSMPEKFSLYRKQAVREMTSLGIGSLGIVALISVFMGAVITLQTASNIDSAFIPAYTVGFATRQSVLLEFSPTIIALILAGKIGSSIASEIGTMRVTEQIDALEIMGINSAAYIILPKIIATLIMNPFLIIISMFLAISGGMMAGTATGIVSIHDFIDGVTLDFKPFHLIYALIKTFIFAFVLASVPAYYGYYTSGGALDVGKSSTNAVVYTSILILILNYVITQLVLI